MAYTTIDDPSAHFQTTLWTGDGNYDRSITNSGNSDLQPDLVWIKSRGTTNDHLIFNSTVGVGKYLRANDTNDETTIADTLQAFQSDGIQIGTDSRLNTNTDTVVSWQWKANGGSTTTNDASSTGVGDQDSVYQANTTAGFSIVTYTGTGSDNEDYAHGLGASPELILIKARDASTGWSVNHISKGMTSGYFQLQANSAFASASNNVKAVSSTTFRLGVDSWVNGSGVDFVGYFFKSIQGYSKFGSFTGNGNTDGPFVYTGFKPAWLMYKEDESAGGWGIWDNKRVTYNPINIRVLANTNAADDTSNDNRQDFLSNGFKVRTNSGGFNESGRTIYYMAFAEHPFVSSEGVPTTAG